MSDHLNIFNPYFPLDFFPSRVGTRKTTARIVDQGGLAAGCFDPETGIAHIPVGTKAYDRAVRRHEATHAIVPAKNIKMTALFQGVEDQRIHVFAQVGHNDSSRRDEVTMALTDLRNIYKNLRKLATLDKTHLRIALVPTARALTILHYGLTHERGFAKPEAVRRTKKMIDAVVGEFEKRIGRTGLLDTIRDTAVALESDNMNTAYRLMKPFLSLSNKDAELPKQKQPKQQPQKQQKKQDDNQQPNPQLSADDQDEDQDDSNDEESNDSKSDEKKSDKKDEDKKEEKKSGKKDKSKSEDEDESDDESDETEEGEDESDGEESEDETKSKSSKSDESEDEEDGNDSEDSDMDGNGETDDSEDYENAEGNSDGEGEDGGEGEGDEPEDDSDPLEDDPSNDVTCNEKDIAPDAGTKGGVGVGSELQDALEDGRLTAESVTLLDTETLKKILKAGTAYNVPMPVMGIRKLDYRMSKKITKGRSEKLSHSGMRIRLNRIPRIFDPKPGKIFERTGEQRGGTVLIDASGSMNLSDDRLAKLAERIPIGQVAYYSGGFGKYHIPGQPACNGVLVIYSKDGRSYAKKENEKLPNVNYGNEVDFQALQWLLKQPAPRWLISDIQFCGSSKTSNEAGIELAKKTYARKMINFQPTLSHLEVELKMKTELDERDKPEQFDHLMIQLSPCPVCNGTARVSSTKSAYEWKKEPCKNCNEKGWKK